MFVLHMWGVLIEGAQKITGHTDAAFLAAQLMEEIDTSYYFLNENDTDNTWYRGPKKWDGVYAFNQQNLILPPGLTDPGNLGRDMTANPGPPAKPIDWENTTDRRRWDDIDDYDFLEGAFVDGVDGRGPRDIEGNIIPARRRENATTGFMGFIRAVDVFYVQEVAGPPISYIPPLVPGQTNFKMVNITVFWRENGELRQYVLSEVRPNTPPW